MVNQHGHWMVSGRPTLLRYVDLRLSGYFGMFSSQTDESPTTQLERLRRLGSGLHCCRVEGLFICETVRGSYRRLPSKITYAHMERIRRSF